MNVANTILAQLGGSKFAAMTGSKNFLADGNTLRMTLSQNKSGANMLYITLDDMDTYEMRFIKYTKGCFNKETFVYADDKITEIETFTGVYFDMLRKIFTDVTGMDTTL
jgi:hypothetical protein